MSLRIKLTQKAHKVLDEHFKNAPKTYEETLKKGRFVPFEKGTKYKNLNKKRE